MFQNKHLFTLCRIRGVIAPYSILFIFYVIINCLINCKPSNSLPSRFADPESTIYTYWHCINQRNYHEAHKIYIGNKSYYNKFRGIFFLPDVDSFLVDTFLIKNYLDRKTVDLIYVISFYSHKQNVINKSVIGDRLILTSHGWRINDILHEKE